MERKIGEIFEFEGHKLKVKTDSRECKKCFFYNRDCSSIRDVSGFCSEEYRTDKKSVIFVEAKDEQPQEQAEQPKDEQSQLNLCEILKYCPQGETFWSPLLGDVKLHDINHKRNFIVISLESGETWDINADGTITFGDVTSPEVMLYPSREQRDWSKFTAPWLKKERFDPKTLKAFDRVLSRYDGGCWSANLFSHIEEEDNKYHGTCSFVCNGSLVKFCIPYNDDTKHLVGTKEEAPVFYRYWED